MRAYTLLDHDGRPYTSDAPGGLGGHRGSLIYGRLECPAGRRAIARGGYVAHRVFFADAATAHSAGYRPCAVCLPDAYRAWRLTSAGERAPRAPRATTRAGRSGRAPQW